VVTVAEQTVDDMARLARRAGTRGGGLSSGPCTWPWCAERSRASASPTSSPPTCCRWPQMPSSCPRWIALAAQLGLVAVDSDMSRVCGS